MEWVCVLISVKLTFAMNTKKNKVASTEGRNCRLILLVLLCFGFVDVYYNLYE